MVTPIFQWVLLTIVLYKIRKHFLFYGRFLFSFVCFVLKPVSSVRLSDCTVSWKWVSVFVFFIMGAAVLQNPALILSSCKSGRFMKEGVNQGSLEMLLNLQDTRVRSIRPALGLNFTHTSHSDWDINHLNPQSSLSLSVVVDAGFIGLLYCPCTDYLFLTSCAHIALQQLPVAMASASSSLIKGRVC